MTTPIPKKACCRCFFGARGTGFSSPAPGGVRAEWQESQKTPARLDRSTANPSGSPCQSWQGWRVGAVSAALPHADGDSVRSLCRCRFGRPADAAAGEDRLDLGGAVAQLAQDVRAILADVRRVLLR